MANGQFINPISAGVESARGQFRDFFQSQAEVNLLKQAQERQERKEARRLYGEIIGTALKIDDPAQRLSFIRGMTGALGVELPPQLDQALPGMVANEGFLRGMKRLDRIADAITQAGQGETAQEIAGLPAATRATSPEEEAALAVTFRRDIAGLTPGLTPSPRSALLAEEVRAQLPTKPLPETLRKDVGEILEGRPAPGEQLERLRGAFPAPEGAREEITTTLKGGRPEISRRVTVEPEKPPRGVAELAFRAAGGDKQAEAALERMKRQLTERQGRATTSTFISWATSDDPKLQKRGEKAIALWKGLNESAVVQARVRAFDRATELFKTDINLMTKFLPTEEERRDPAKLRALEARKRLEFRQLYRRILEDYFLTQGAGREGANLSSLSDEELAQRALEQDDEAAMEELIRRGEL